MTQAVRTESTPHLRRGRRWLRTLLTGVGLFVATTIVLALTGNPNLYPTVILIGNFLVPIVFVAFLYDHQHISSLSLDTVAASFCIGGVLGVLGAAILESVVLPIATNPTHGLSLGGAFLVGLIEEASKIAAVIFLARKMPHTSQMDGLLLGEAVGMGFAALESTGYALFCIGGRCFSKANSNTALGFYTSALRTNTSRTYPSGSHKYNCSPPFHLGRGPHTT